MTQPPPPPPPGYPDRGYPGPGYPEPVQPGAQYPPPPYPPGREPIPPRPRQPRRSPVIAPLLAFLGLILVGGGSLLTMTLLNDTLDTAATATASPSAGPLAVVDDPVVAETDAPPPILGQLETPEPEVDDPLPPEVIAEAPSEGAVDVNGSILFTRGGDIWSASGRELRRLTRTDSLKDDIGPTWSPDGKFMYFVRKTKREAQSGSARLEGKYTLYPTDVMRMRANGSDRKRVYDAFIRRGGQWFTHVLQPSASPDGKTVAVVSDGPDGSGPVVLHVLNTRSGNLRRVETPSQGDFGHNDPDFSRDGKKIAFTYNDRKGTEGQPRIAIHSCRSRTNCVAGSTKYLKQGYANPSWSRDMSWLAAEETSGTGRDIVIVSAARGDVRVKLTDGGDSFAPEVSPDGDQIAYLRRDGTDMNVRVMTLDIDEKGKISLVSDRAVTTDGGVDGQSPISWHIPKERRSTPDASEEPDETEATESDGVPEGAPPPPPGA